MPPDNDAELDSCRSAFAGSGTSLKERRPVTLALGMRDRASLLSEDWRRRGHDLQLGMGGAASYATRGQVVLKDATNTLP